MDRRRGSRWSCSRSRREGRARCCRTRRRSFGEAYRSPAARRCHRNSLREALLSWDRGGLRSCLRTRVSPTRWLPKGAPSSPRSRLPSSHTKVQQDRCRASNFVLFLKSARNRGLQPPARATNPHRSGPIMFDFVNHRSRERSFPCDIGLKEGNSRYGGRTRRFGHASP